VGEEDESATEATVTQENSKKTAAYITDKNKNTN
jgi:hypothetical protein